MPRKNLSTVRLVPERSVEWYVEDYRLSAADIVNKQMFLNTGSTILYVSNPDTAGDSVVTIEAQPDMAGRTNAAGFTGDPVYGAGYRFSVPRATSRFFGPFRQAWWNQTSTDPGYIYLEISKQATAAFVINT